MEEKIYCVYVHKVSTEEGPMYYTGITRRKTCQRWKPSAYKGNPKFSNYIDRYGWDNIAHVVVASGMTRKEALKLEDTLICFYHSIGRTLNMIRSGNVESDPEYVRKRRHYKYLDNLEYYRQSHKEWYENNKEKQLLYFKAYREEHNDSIKEYLANYREEHREEAREYGRKYRAENKDKIKTRNSEQYQKNREARIEYATRYYQENKEKINARRREKRRIKRENDKKGT